VIRLDITSDDAQAWGRKLNSDQSEGLRIVVGILLFLVAFTACDESLPPRADPDAVLVTTLYGLEGPVTINAGEQTSLAGSVFIELRNVHDEVLQDDARIGVTVEVWMKDQPQNRATIQLGRSDLMNGGIIQTGKVTLGPDSAANFLKRWNHRTNIGQPFWEFVRLTPRTTTHGVPYLESDPIPFVGEAAAQVFEHVQATRSQRVVFTFVYWIF